jgi:hypothetical protein
LALAKTEQKPALIHAQVDDSHKEVIIMKVFISHSWKDKTQADMLTRDLSSVAEVWQDIQQLKPGDRIQASIDEAIEQMDVVIVLWSENAAVSDGVAEEVKTSLRLGKKMVPCLLDETSLESIPGLVETLGIDFEDYRFGFGRLCAFLLRFQTSDLGIEIQEELKDIKDIDGVLNYLQDYRIKQGIKGTDRDYWIQRSIEAIGRMDERMEKLQSRIKEAGDFIQQIYTKLGQAGEDRAKLQAILQEVIRKEHTDPEILGQVRVAIEREISKLPVEGKATSTKAKQSTERTKSFSKDLRAAAQDGRSQIRGRLRPFLQENLLEEATDLLLYYINTARQNLEVMANFSVATSSQASMLVVQYLFEYLEDPHDLLAEAKYGIWGYLDDAWLIHNTAYRLVEAGLIPVAAFSIRWESVVAADRIARSCLPSAVLAELENSLMQFLSLIATEAMSYNPGFANVERGYHPYMGGAFGAGEGDGVVNTMSELIDAQLASEISFDFG